MRVGVVVAALAAAVLVGCGDTGPASLYFVDINPLQPRIGETVVVKFAALDSRGVPAEGVPVKFRLQQDNPAVKLGIVETQTNKGSGEARTTLVATGRVSSVVVIAESGDKVAYSPAISFAGSDVSARGITFQCGPFSGQSSGGIHAIGAYGPERNMIAGVRLDCTAHVSDRNGDGIPGALVSFLTEAGTIGPSSTSNTDVVGNATVLYKTSYPLPQDVDPGQFRHTVQDDASHIRQPLAPDWMVPHIWRSNPMTMALPDPQCPAGCDEPRRTDPIRPGRINNPRDNLVAMIAVTSGEEEFVDANNNGVYDNTETFIDSTEPFVDSNDDGTWSPGELYVDTNGDGSWTGKNGQYDATTLLWAQNRILWTGIPEFYDYQAGAPPSPPPGYVPTVAQILPLSAPAIPHFGDVTVVYRMSDPWFNVFAQNGDGDGCVGPSPTPVTTFPETFGDVGIRMRYPTTIDASVKVRDAHDPNEDPRPAANSPPVPWTVFFSCKSTASPNEGFKVDIGLGALTGTVE